MKYSLVFSLLLFAGIDAFSMVIESGRSIVITHPVNEDLYLAGGTITVNAPVHGDLVVAGGTIYINDTVDNEILVAGGNVTISGYVGGRIRCAGGNVHISRSVGGDVVIAGGTLAIERDATISGGLLATGGDLMLNGAVKGNIRSAAAQFRLYGSAGGDLDCRGGNIEIEGTVAGNSVLAASQNLDIGTGASFGGGVRYWAPGKVNFGQALKNGKAVFDQNLEIESGRWYFLGALSFLGLLWFLGAALLEIVLLQYFFGGALRKAAKTFSTDALRSLGSGFLFIVGMPVIIGLAFITLVGIPVAITLLFGYIATWIFCCGLVSVVLAHWLNDRQAGGWKFWRLTWVALGIFVLLRLVLFVPIAGWILLLVLICMVYGGVLLNIRWRKRGAAAVGDDK